MNRVFILGSGFSTYAGAPLSRAVLPAVFSTDRQEPSVLELKSFLEKFLFRGECDWIQTSEIEEVLSRLDLIRHYKPYPNIDYNQVSHFEELLLSKFIELLTPEHTESEHFVYKKFAELVHSGDKIVSFNYDLIVENLLKRSGKNYNYCLKPQNGEQPIINLLKLHGSINLYYCHLCSSVYHIELRKADKGPLVCEKCSGGSSSASLRHFIIAPTLFKSYSLPVLRNLWFKALEFLKDTGEIYFLGYSLPEADILSYQLFDFAKRFASGKQTVYLVNGPRLGPERFEQIYGQDLVNTRLYLEEWITQN